MLTIFELVQQNPKLLLNRDFLIDLVTISNHFTDEQSLEGEFLYRYKIIEKEPGKIFVVNDVTTRELIEISVPAKPYMSAKTILEITPEHVPSISAPTKTTLGNLITNYYLLINIFGDKIPYWNKRWDQKAISELITEQFHKGNVSVNQIYTFQNTLNYMPCLSDLFTVSVTEKCITIDPAVKKRRDEVRKLIREGNISPEDKVKYEDELIALDKASHKGDEAEEFLTGGKAYAIQRKRLFLGIGLVEPFGGGVDGFEYINTVLDEGWEIGDIQTISNDIRRGSYSRGKLTAVGGAIMKLLARIFQELKIVSPDCKTQRTIDVLINKDVGNTVLSRTIVVDGKYIRLTKENLRSYIGKVVQMRSPMMCESKGGVCSICVDGYFTDMGIENLNLQPMNIGSVLQNQSMKSMHGAKIQLNNIASLDQYIV